MQTIINFVCEDAHKKVSGGYIYNHHVLNGLKRRGYLLRYFDANNINTLTNEGITIVDSISVNDIAEVLLTKLEPEHLILLCHLPPELQVAYDNANNKNLLSPLTQVIQQSHILFTGTACKEYMVSTYQLHANKLHMIKPGLCEGWRYKTEFAVLPYRLIVAASLIPNKGYELLLQSLKALEYLPWQLEIYGESRFAIDYANSIFALVQQYQLGDRISYKGVVSQQDLNVAMVNADLMIHLSAYEPYSMISLEAINAKLPMLSSVSGELAEFSRAKNVRYIDAYTVESCAQALADLLCNKNAYQSLCQQGGGSARTWATVVDEFASLLQHVKPKKQQSGAFI
ncbi:glycosyltransferase family 4 protein [Agaribacter flavus]|uniref:Glycosyltransferase family 4 protein n=1 Tax=Agaribacter flavus TaxID=1902781 RepID=A0ABV7FMA1_9ALTE